MDDGFDVRAYRHNLKLRKQSADQAVYDHRGDRRCPVCDSSFDGLIHASSGITIPSRRDGDTCVEPTDGDLVAFVH